MEKKILNISSDFTRIPGARYISDGKYSGEEFYENLLINKYNEALTEGVKLEIIFDGVLGPPSSFLLEAFGRLYINNGKNKIWDHIIITSNDDPSLRNIIIKLAERYEG